jgi:hypothetical protein
MARKVERARSARQEGPPPNIDSVSDLVEISVWLGTYRERMRIARSEDQDELAKEVRRWNDHLLQRRAELA